MNTNIIEKRYNYIVRSTLGATGQFTQTINCDFIPDEMIVRAMNYFNNGAEAGISYVSSNITPRNDILTQIGDGLALSLQSFYTLQRPVQGTFTFTITDVNGNLVTAGRAGTLSIVLEFVKYQDQKQEKIY